MRSASRFDPVRRSAKKRKTKARSGQPLIPSSSKDTAPTPERIQQIAWGYAPTLILEAALNYRLFDLLDETPRTVDELAHHTGASVRGLTAILNALVGLEFLARKANRYTLTPESATFLVSTKPAYHGTYFMHMTRQLIPRWLRLSEAATLRPAGGGNEPGDRRADLLR